MSCAFFCVYLLTYNKKCDNELETHHIISLEKDSGLAFEDLNLVCLCRDHHEQAEKGELKADYLRALARRREAR